MSKFQFGDRLQLVKEKDLEALMASLSTRELLAEYASLLNRYGTHSVEAEDFIDRHSNDAEFVELAMLSKNLKEALTPIGCQNHQTPA